MGAPQRGEVVQTEGVAEPERATRRRSQPTTRPPQVRPGRRMTVGGMLIRLVRLILLIMLLGSVLFGTYVYLERPAWAEPYLAPLLDPAP